MKEQNTIITTTPTVEEYRHLIGSLNNQRCTQRDIDVSNYFFSLCLRNDYDKTSSGIAL